MNDADKALWFVIVFGLAVCWFVYTHPEQIMMILKGQ